MIRKIFTLIFIFNTGFIIAQNTNTSYMERDTLNQESMMYVKSQPYSKEDAHISEESTNELEYIKDDYRYAHFKYKPRPWLIAVH